MLVEYDEEEIYAIQEEYRRKKLIESLVGPFVSTVFHILLIIVLAIFITDKVKEPVSEITVTLEEIEEVLVEETPEVEEPEPLEEQSETLTPVLTTVAIENAETNDPALEEVNDEAPSTDDNIADNAVSDVVVSPSAFASAAVYGGRSSAGRASAVSNFGGSSVGQDKLMKALWWLIKVQNPDGSWGNSDKQAYTGLALLTFLAHGETPTSKEFGKNVKKAIMWLTKDRMKKNQGKGYGHAIKTYALSEAYAMTGISLIERLMNEGIRIIIDGQQEGGSFNYDYNTDQGRQDLSLAGWNYQALKAAYGAGCEEKGLLEAIEKSKKWLINNTEGDNQFAYMTANNEPLQGRGKGANKATMRAVGTLCLQLFGEGANPEIQNDLEMIATKDLAQLNWNNPPNESLYGWYYATQAMFQTGGKKWKAWNRKFQHELSEAQHEDGYWVYPGHFHCKSDEHTIKIYATTLCSLMLTVYYRYLPSTKGAIGKTDKNVQKAENLVVIEEEGLDLVE